MSAVAWADACGGGSGGSLNVDADVVTKHAGDSGLAKLRAEAAWLTNVSRYPHLRARFPAVAAAPNDARPALSLERLPGDNARKLALVDNAIVPSTLEGAVDFAFCDLFTAEDVSRPAQDPRAWYTRQVTRRLDAARRDDQIAQALLSRTFVLPDGSRIAGPLGGGGVHTVHDGIADFTVRAVGLVHGDFHLGNILIDVPTDRFWLLDPRGDFDGTSHFDPAYDVAKLLHEVYYVAARAGALRVRALVNASECETAFLIESCARVEELKRFSKFGRVLATRACRCLSPYDTTVAARATTVTGLLFLTMLPLSPFAEGAWQAILAYGVAWIHAGLSAMDGGRGVGACARVWDELAELMIPSMATPLAVLES